MRISIDTKMVALFLAVGMAIGESHGQTAAAAPDAQTPAAETPKLSEKQKALAEQTEKLVAMATSLKEEVDRTNKNVLSLKVVRTAEEIEQYARRMKDQAKK